MLTPEQVEARFQRIEAIIDAMATRQAEMVARQQYHDEAFDRMDTRLNTILHAVQIDAENIHRLANI